jgi:hypothetical protein
MALFSFVPPLPTTAPRAPNSKLGTWTRHINALTDQSQFLWAIPDPATFPNHRVLLCSAATPHDGRELRVILKNVRVVSTKIGLVKRLLPRCYGGVKDHVRSLQPGGPGSFADGFAQDKKRATNEILATTRFGSNQSENKKSRELPGTMTRAFGDVYASMAVNLCDGSPEARRQLGI